MRLGDHRSHRRRGLALGAWTAILLAFVVSGCDSEAARDADRGEDGFTEIEVEIDERLLLSPDAKVDTHEMLVEDMATERHPSDGGGRAWFEGMEAKPSYPVSSRQRFTILYEAGPFGVAEGGAIYLQTSPFWDWDPPQSRYADAPGYTEVESLAAGVTLELGDYSDLFEIRIRGRALEANERIRIRFGAGEAGVRVDLYAEEDEQIFLSVDGDGDGVRKLIAKSPRLDIHAAPPRRLRVTLPTTASPGEKIRLTIAALDSQGNAALVEQGEVTFVETPSDFGLPDTITLDATHRGHRTIEVVAPPAGVYRLIAKGRGELAGIETLSNPMVVEAGLPRILWGDLHGHSQLSDGTGTPDQYYDYARNVAALDVSALTDHDHWGMHFLDSNPEMWERIKRAAREHHDPGRFVTLLGYEWTSWLHGHRHVLYFEDDGEVFSSVDPRYESPRQLWDALAGRPALTFAHHSAGGPVATNWRFPPDPVLEPVTEIVSVHGSSEALDSPGLIYNPVPGNFVRDTLDVGYRFGFIGSGDSHDGHPGLAQLALKSAQSGLAAIQSEERTREAVLAALRARRVYATNGERIHLRVSIDGAPMGSLVPLPAEPVEGATAVLVIDVVGTAPIERVDIIRSGRQTTLDGMLQQELSIERNIPPLLAGEYHYVRVVQANGGVAWSSPIYAAAPERKDEPATTDELEIE